MAVVRNPIPVRFSPDTTTRVLFQVPCIVDGIDVKQKFDAIDAALASTDVTSRGTVSDITYDISNVSSSISASIGDLTNTVNNLAATIPNPDGPTNAVQYKTGTHSISGSANFVFNPATTNLTVGTDVVAGNNVQIAIGKYNTTGNTTSLFVVGAGTTVSDRFDAFKVENHGSKITNVVHGGGIVNKVKTVTNGEIYYLKKSDYYIHAVSNDIVTVVFLPFPDSVEVGTTYIIRVGGESNPSSPIELRWDQQQQLNQVSGPNVATGGPTTSWRIIKWKEFGGIEYWETW